MQMEFSVSFLLMRYKTFSHAMQQILSRISSLPISMSFRQSQKN